MGAFNVITSGPEARMCASQFAVLKAQWEMKQNAYLQMQQEVEAQGQAAKTLGAAAKASVESQGSQQIGSGSGQIFGGSFTMGCNAIDMVQGRSLDNQIADQDALLNRTRGWQEGLRRPAAGVNGGVANDANMDAFKNKVDAGDFSESVDPYKEQLEVYPARADERAAALKRVDDLAKERADQLKSLNDQRSALSSKWQTRGQIGSAFSQGSGAVAAGTIAINNAKQEQIRAISQFVSDAMSTAFKAMMDVIASADQRSQQAYQTINQAISANYHA